MAGLWIRDPLSIFADGAERGVIVEEGRIVQLVAAGQTPTERFTATFDASEHVVVPGPVSYTHLTLPTPPYV